jgi:hypothetical protein
MVIDLPHRDGFIAIVQKVLIKRPRVRDMREQSVIPVDLPLVRTIAAQEAGARSHANGHLAIGTFKQKPARSEPVDIRRLDLRLPITTPDDNTPAVVSMAVLKIAWVSVLRMIAPLFLSNSHYGLGQPEG